MNANEVGDGLAALLAAQEAEAEAVRFPALEEHASALIALDRELGDPVVWPVGAAAERITGAATLMSEGRIRVREWNSEVRGERVLVFAVTALTPVSLFAAAQQALNMGADTVHGCGLRIGGFGETGLGPLTSFHVVHAIVLSGAGVS